MTTVLIGAETANRRYVSYEIEKSMECGNGLFGLRIHNIRDQNGKTDMAGSIPALLLNAGYPIYTWSMSEEFAKWVEEAHKSAHTK